jgi:hypothetical protein
LFIYVFIYFLTPLLLLSKKKSNTQSSAENEEAVELPRLNLRWAIETESIKKARAQDRGKQVEEATRERIDPRILALEKPLLDGKAKRAHELEAGKSCVPWLIFLYIPVWFFVFETNNS